jgi:hypothetical protein
VNKPTAKIYKDMGGINPNLYTIGVECVAKAFEKLTSSQVIVLPELLLYIHRTYHVTLDNIYGHNQFDSINRALDPVSVYTVKSAVEGVYFQKLIEYTPVVKSPVYWQQNAIEGKGINGAWLKQLVLNYVAMYLTVSDYHEAIEYLVSKGIITTPDYWLGNTSVFKGDYVRKLLSNMGKVL